MAGCICGGSLWEDGNAHAADDAPLAARHDQRGDAHLMRDTNSGAEDQCGKLAWAIGRSKCEVKRFDGRPSKASTSCCASETRMEGL
jgi:hypothetical protein